MNDELEARIARLEAMHDIGNVMADYTHYFDTGWAGAGRDAAKVGALFTEDAVWEVDGAAQEGRKAIQEWCEKYGHTARMSLHIVMNPKIAVDGDCAQGSWNGFIPLVTASGQALWVAGRYECKFVRRNADWRIARLSFFTAFLTPYDEGFARTQFFSPSDYEADHQ